MTAARSGGYHVPVLLAEVLKYLEPERGGLFLDGTLGGGSHAEALLEASAGVRLLGVDHDPEAIGEAARRLARFGERVKLVRGDYADVAEVLDERLAGALLDLGVSSRQIDEEARGFSFRPGVRLDMRMAGGGAEAGPTAAELLNELGERELADLFFLYGEERRSRRLAAAVVRRRVERPFATSDDLVSVLRQVLGPRMDAQDKARIFQALRIAVNRELDSLERGLPALRDRLEPGGVLVVLSYHSLEDRLVKVSFREWSSACVCPPALPVCRCRGRALGITLTRRAVKAGPEEIEANVRARSVRLRAWRKAAGDAEAA
jgi:16S rRNA (cytosine1402-N4)-methyltransferase